MEKNLDKKKINLKEIGIPKLAIMLICGILLIVLSFPNSSSPKKSNKSNISNTSNANQKATKSDEETVNDYVSNQESRLKKILKKVEGIGETEVMITVSSSKELVPLKDNPYQEESLDESDKEGGKRKSSKIDKKDETVLTADESGKNIPYIVKEIQPNVKGVVVIAQGGANTTVINEILDSVQVLFDVPAHKIKVMKMNHR